MVAAAAGFEAAHQTSIVLMLCGRYGFPDGARKPLSTTDRRFL
jgi:hypothetical protein